VHFQPIEISAFAAVVSSIGVVSGRFRVDPAPADSDVIADFDRAAIDEKNVFGTGHLVQPTEPLEERFESRIQRVQASVEAAPAKSVSEVGRAFKQV
jgi:hypothetical protein